VQETSHAVSRRGTVSRLVHYARTWTCRSEWRGQRDIEILAFRAIDNGISLTLKVDVFGLFTSKCDVHVTADSRTSILPTYI